MNPALRPLLETIVDGNTDERAPALMELLDLLGVDVEDDGCTFDIRGVREVDGRFRIWFV